MLIGRLLLTGQIHSNQIHSNDAIVMHCAHDLVACAVKYDLFATQISMYITSRFNYVWVYDFCSLSVYVHVCVNLVTQNYCIFPIWLDISHCELYKDPLLNRGVSVISCHLVNLMSHILKIRILKKAWVFNFERCKHQNE